MTESPTIIAGVDGSRTSADALALADTLGAALGIEPTPVLVHPFGDFERALGDGRDGDELRGLADAVHDEMRALGTPIEDRRLTLVSDRSTARGLQRIADQRQALLIAIGASSRSRLGRVLLGGTAERLMSGAPCPVAIAPRGYATRSQSLRAIGVAFDGSPESRAALDWAAGLAARSDGRVRILGVHEPLISPYPAFQTAPLLAQNETARDHLARQLEAAAIDLRHAGVGVDASLLTGDAAAVLAEESGDLDVLVTGSRGYGPSRAVLLGSVSRAVVQRAASPVIVLPRDANANAIGVLAAQTNGRLVEPAGGSS
jgi:nucleotide-binding universal stress UspA family protein